MPKNKKINLIPIVDFIYEVGILNRTPRSGLWFWGNGHQSVAEHLLRTSYITYVLCNLVPKANRERAVLMALFHDLGEGRTSDLNHMHQRYGRLNEKQALDDLTNALPFGIEIRELYKEEQARETLEAQLVKDADTLDWLTTLREEESRGNPKSKRPLQIALERLKSKAGKELGKLILKTDPDHWWWAGHKEKGHPLTKHPETTKRK